MSVMSFEGVIENGKIRLTENVRLPENVKVYVVVPDVESKLTAYIGSPHLVYPEQAEEFKKEVIEES